MKLIAFFVAWSVACIAMGADSLKCRPTGKPEGVSVRVETKEAKAAAIRKRMLALGHSADEIASAVADAAQYAIVKIERSTIGAANLDNFSFVIFSEKGEVVKRENGKFEIPEVPSGAGGKWWNIHVVKLDDFAESSILFRVVDLLQNKHDDFLIYKPGQIQATRARLLKEDAAKKQKEIDDAAYRANPGLAQRRAVERFPALGVSTSPLNREFVARVQEYRTTNPTFFEDPAWPIALAEECSQALVKKADAVAQQ